MTGEILSAEDRAYFLHLMRRQINSTVDRRVNVLLLLDDGWTASAIAKALYLDESTVREHSSLYKTLGRQGVEFLFYAGRAPSLDDVQQASLAKWVEATAPRTCAEVTAFVKSQFAVDYTPHAMAKLLGRLGFVYRKPKCVPAKADASVQQAFLDNSLKPLMNSASPQAPLYFVDAVHPSYTAHPAHGWLRKGATVELKSNHGRSRLNIKGALSWRPDCRIRTVYLPSYAPNLNLIERFWLFMKRKVLFNRAFANFALFKRAFEDFFRCLPEFANQIASIVTDRFHLIGRTPAGIPSA